MRENVRASVIDKTPAQFKTFIHLLGFSRRFVASTWVDVSEMETNPWLTSQKISFYYKSKNEKLSSQQKNFSLRCYILTELSSTISLMFEGGQETGRSRKNFSHAT